MDDSANRLAGPILVSDFDGTVCRGDFFEIVRRELVPPEAHDHWADYEAGRITHFEGLRNTFWEAAVGEPTLIETARRMEPDPDLAAEIAALELAGWRVIVASAGCAWYIERHLGEAGVDIEFHANPGRIVDGRMLMDLPRESPYFSAETGIDKVAVVRAAQAGGGPVAFSGDGSTDLEPSLLVPPDLRFARGALAEKLRARGEGFRPFERWAEVARALRE